MSFSLSRVWTVVTRYWYAHRRTFSSAFDFLYWPLIDILLFGFIGTSLASQKPAGFTSLIIGLVLWQVLQRTSLEVSRNLVQELWDENLVNFFASPLTIYEWMAGLMISGLLALCITLPYAFGLVALIFHQNLLNLGWILVPCVGLLIVGGWILGFIAAGFLIYWGQKIETMVWAMSWIAAPFCSVYYPVEVLPDWMQQVSQWLPMTYVFEGIRGYLETGILPIEQLQIGALLSGIYLMGSLSFFMFMFSKSKAQGLR